MKGRGGAKGSCALLDQGSREGGTCLNHSVDFSGLFLNIHLQVLFFNNQKNNPNMCGLMHVCDSVCVKSEDNLCGSVFSLPYILQRLNSGH